MKLSLFIQASVASEPWRKSVLFVCLFVFTNMVNFSAKALSWWILLSLTLSDCTCIWELDSMYHIETLVSRFVLLKWGYLNKHCHKCHLCEEECLTLGLFPRKYIAFQERVEIYCTWDYYCNRHVDNTFALFFWILTFYHTQLYAIYES